MRGVSSGAIVAVAIAVVALIVALVAWVFVFHSNNSSTGSAASHSQQGALGQISNTSTGSIEQCMQQMSIASGASMVYNQTTGQATIYVTLANPCNTTFTITSVAVNGVPVTLNSITDVVNHTTYTGTQPGQIHILPGVNDITIMATLQQGMYFAPGEPLFLQISFSNGETVGVQGIVQYP